MPEQWRMVAGKLPEARFVELRAFTSWPWTDGAAEPTKEVGAAMLELLDRTDARRAESPKLPESSGLEDAFLPKLARPEADEWKRARAQAERAGTFFMTWPHPCAVGTKP